MFFTITGEFDVSSPLTAHLRPLASKNVAYSVQQWHTCLASEYPLTHVEPLNKIQSPDTLTTAIKLQYSDFLSSLTAVTKGSLTGMVANMGLSTLVRIRLEAIDVYHLRAPHL